MPKCKYCDQTINFMMRSNGRAVATVPGSVKRFLYDGEIVKGPEIHVCPDTEKQHKRREIREKYATQEKA